LILFSLAFTIEVFKKLFLNRVGAAASRPPIAVPIRPIQDIPMQRLTRRGLRVAAGWLVFLGCVLPTSLAHVAAQAPGAQPGVRPPAGQVKPPVAQPKPAAGQPKPVAGQARPRGAAAAKPVEKPPMQALDLPTPDGVALRAYYFPSDIGQEAVPVMIIHEWQGQASTYAPLVKKLQDLNCAVIVPELRGHGGSRQQMAAGGPRTLDVAKMNKADVTAMITSDLETVKKFLVQENNAKKLNLNALAVIGVREGAVIASQWAVRDLNFPSLGAIKQGQDVKAMVLISPDRVIKGVSLEEAFNDRMLATLPFLIVYGESSRLASQSERLVKRLETTKKRLTRGDAVGLQSLPINTSLEGHPLVNDGPGVMPKIIEFLQAELITKSARIPWVERP